MTLYYGLQDKRDITKFTQKVVSVLGGGFNAERALIEICAVETDSGTFPDRHPETLGVGLTQFDQVGFDDVVARTRPKYKKRVLDMLGFDLDALKLADLAYDPLLALTMTRLKYLMLPDEIPSTVEGRAKYWKQNYNSHIGKGTVEDYIDSASKFA